MPPRDPQLAIGRRKSKPNLDMPEPELAEMLHQYCDLRRRGFDQAAIKTKTSWPKNHQNLLLKEAQRRDMPGSQVSQAHAVTEWLLAMYDAGTQGNRVLMIIFRIMLMLPDPIKRERATDHGGIASCIGTGSFR